MNILENQTALLYKVTIFGSLHLSTIHWVCFFLFFTKFLVILTLFFFVDWDLETEAFDPAGYDEENMRKFSDMYKLRTISDYNMGILFIYFKTMFCKLLVM